MTTSYGSKHSKGGGYTIRILWGLAKSPELHLDDESLHDLVYRETGKESIKKLTKRELAAVCGLLQRQKDSVKRQNGELKEPRGNPATDRQRKKIAWLETELGWADKKGKLRALVMNMYGVETVEWLDYSQCSGVIEALKAILDRKKGNGDE